MIYQEIILYIMFGCIGFFLAFFLGKVLNVGLLLLMSWVSFKVIELVGKKPDWTLFHRFSDLLVDLGRAFIDLILNMVNMASIGAMILFVLGGVTGMVLNVWRRVRI